MQYRANNKLVKLPGFTADQSLSNSKCYIGDSHPAYDSLIIPCLISNAAACSACERCIDELADLPEGAPVPRALKGRCNMCRWCTPESDVGTPGGAGGCITECRRDVNTNQLECKETCPGSRWMFTNFWDVL